MDILSSADPISVYNKLKNRQDKADFVIGMVKGLDTLMQSDSPDKYIGIQMYNLHRLTDVYMKEYSASKSMMDTIAASGTVIGEN